MLEDQQDFLRSLETAENQMMFDEDFMILVSKIANKNSDKMFKKDFRDPALGTDIDNWLNQLIRISNETLDNALSFYNEATF